MNRRDMLKATAATLAAFVLPAPRPRLNLLAFCAKREGNRFDMRLPYHLEDWCYATDSHICVRVRPESADSEQCRGTIPPFGSLSWNHAQIRGWRALPKLEPLMAYNSCCPACDGTGFAGGVCGIACEKCGEFGCDACGMKGVIAPPFATVCRRCEGNGIGKFPTLVELDGRYFDAGLYAKARRLGAEFVNDHWRGIKAYDLLKFRFDGGDGLLMGIDRYTAERRLVTV